MQQSKKCGQAATEYMIVIGISMLLLTPVIIIGNNAVIDLKYKTDSIVAREAVDEITEIATIVYSQGAPAKITKSIRFPQNIISTSISDKIIRIEMRYRSASNDVFSIVEFNVTGTLPTTPGNHKISIEAISNGVNITALT